MQNISEPLGALVGLIVLKPFLTPELLSYLLAFVAGVMVIISFDELLPISFKEGKGHTSILGIITGMAIMAMSLHLFN